MERTSSATQIAAPPSKGTAPCDQLVDLGRIEGHRIGGLLRHAGLVQGFVDQHDSRLVWTQAAERRAQPRNAHAHLGESGNAVADGALMMNGSSIVEGPVQGLEPVGA